MVVTHLVRRNRRRRAILLQTMTITLTASAVSLLLLTRGVVDAFAPSSITVQQRRQNHAASSSPSALHMVLEKPKVKELPKIESLKMESDHLVHPLREVCTLSCISYRLCVCVRFVPCSFFCALLQTCSMYMLDHMPK
jgi:hypothetical protein